MKTCHSQRRRDVGLMAKSTHTYTLSLLFFFPFALLHLNPAVAVIDFIKPEAVYAFLTQTKGLTGKIKRRGVMQCTTFN